MRGRVETPRSLDGRSDGLEVFLSVVVEGSEVAVHHGLPGAFEFHYPGRAPRSDDCHLKIRCRGCVPRLIPLPAGDVDLGTVFLDQGVTYAGRVKDAATGAPLDGLTVELWWEGGLRVGTSPPSGRDGSFVIDLEEPLPTLDMGESGDFRYLLVVPSARGRDFEHVHANISGLQEGHDIAVASSGGLRIRLLRQPGMQPLARVPIVLRARLPDGREADMDAGVTAEDGIFAPRWPGTVSHAYIDLVTDQASSRGLLRRASVAGTDPYDVVIPSTDECCVRVQCEGESAGDPREGVDVTLSAAFGKQGDWFQLRGTTGKSGEVAWTPARTPESAGEGIEIRWWTVSYVGADGMPACLSSGPLRPIPRASPSEPYRIRIPDQGSWDGLWLECVDSSSSVPVRPTAVRARVRLLGGTEVVQAGYLVRLQRETASGPGILWNAMNLPYPGYQGEPLEWVDLVLTVDGARTYRTRYEGDQVASAFSSRTPLPFHIDSSNDAQAELRILGPDGTGRAGIVATLVEGRSTEPKFPMGQQRFATQDGGRLSIRGIDPEAVYSLAFFDVRSGSAAALWDIPGSRLLQGLVLSLDAPRDLIFAVRLSDGRTPKTVRAEFWSPFEMVPRLSVAAESGAVVRVRRLVPELYTARIFGSMGAGDDLSGGGGSPGSHDGTPSGVQTVWWSAVLPAGDLGSTVVLPPPR